MHVGISLATQFKPYEHDRSQVYNDTFDSIPRVNGNIKWVIRQGDLITEDGPDQTLRIVKKMAHDGNKQGSIIIITSKLESSPEPAANLHLPDGEYLLRSFIY